MKLFNNINFTKLKERLTKTRNNIFNKISETLTKQAKIDETTLEQIEEILISSDIGTVTTENIINRARTLLLKEKDRSIEKLKDIIKNELISIVNITYKNFDLDNYKPFVILVIGVNGSGKTTTVGKLAYNFKKADLKVTIGSADTFRAAANDQLEIWANRAGVDIINVNTKEPSAVAYDTIKAAQKNLSDIVIIDTAGRLHTQKNLMDELNKIKRVINNLLPYAPNEIFLVIDGTNGQNALYQVNEFEKYTNITGLIVTKLDGTAKGGIIFRIAAEKKIPIRYIGVGEGIEDLQTFSPIDFVEALFD
ncbi:signal recognition particle-docking protein FtsY [Rosettibacter firmus]|uniref:signal recognition particle-docking protein FtsY n=1 Tax=Rosettibacter firmus TaxID=3111522 RepID=UPI00336C0CC4